MKRLLRKIIRLPAINKIKEKILEKKWNAGKMKFPPSIIKQKNILEFAKRGGILSLIETGTYLGDTVYALKPHFIHIDSIELSEELYNNAVKRFRNDANITIWNGDSPEVLEKILLNKKDKVIFWLDAHYSDGVTSKSSTYGDSPIKQELNVIFKWWIAGSVILIDDARLFIGQDNYPLISELEVEVKNIFPSLTFEVKDDVIRIF
ncbi:MAG: hypothetical protein K9M11_04155 [Candidatus Pacebacteria bacterium]|nr:hypothetical protein [Candidatus Paceibacterota bacterium]